MKQIFILLLFSFSLTAQREDTTVVNDVKSWSAITVTDLGSTNKIDTRYKNVAEKWFFELDTIAESYFPDYVDSLIALYQIDSINYKSQLEAYFVRFREINTQWLNTTNLLQKLWAIRP